MKGLKLSEIINLGFICLFGTVLIFNFERIEKANYLIVGYLVLFLVQIILLRVSIRSRWFEYFKDIVFPVISVFFVFDSMTYIVHGVNPRDIDYILIRIDYLLFGVYPTVWIERFTTPILTELLQLSYSSYYFLPVLLGIVLKKRNKNDAFEEGLSMIILCFYLSYVGYIIFPALGPRYTMAHLQTIELEGVLTFRWIYDILNSIEGIKRDAFPSGHTGITLTVLYLAYKYERRLFYVYLPVTIMLIIATVYCRYHYVIDVLAGVVLSLLTIVVYRLLKLIFIRP